MAQPQAQTLDEILVTILADVTVESVSAQLATALNYKLALQQAWDNVEGIGHIDHHDEYIRLYNLRRTLYVNRSQVNRDFATLSSMINSRALPTDSVSAPNQDRTSGTLTSDNPTPPEQLTDDEQEQDRLKGLGDQIVEADREIRALDSRIHYCKDELEIHEQALMQIEVGMLSNDEQIAVLQASKESLLKESSNTVPTPLF